MGNERRHLSPGETLKRGMRIRLKPFEEPAEILHLEAQEDRLLLVLRFTVSGKAESLVLSYEELVDRLEILPAPPGGSSLQAPFPLPKIQCLLADDPGLRKTIMAIW